MTRDPRLTPARSDLAAAYLRGQVAAERFVEGRRCQVAVEILDVKRRPRSDAPLDTQLLYGEAVQVYEEEDGWAWIQAERDSYVGYVASHGLAEDIAEPTQRVIANRTFVYPAADMKQPVVSALPLEARVRTLGMHGAFAQVARGGFVFAAHLTASSTPAVADFVAVAERLVGTPYLWGGKSAQGIDCSGLVQLAAGAAGLELPRDTSMQEVVGQALPGDGSSAGLVRGDLVFWKGHVGIMADAETLLHANAHHMMVAREPLRTARDRIAGGPGGTPIRCVRRLRQT